MNNRFSRTGPSRRRFLQGAMATSAAQLWARTGFALASAPVGTTGAAPYAALSQLAPGTVQPSGWLQFYLRKQATELGSHLPEVSWPFGEPIWAGDEDPGTELKKELQWWPWEQKGYWIDGATRLGLVLGDRKLLDQAQAPIRYTIDHPDADGYLGADRFKYQDDGYGRWPQNVFFRSLAASSEAGISGIPAALQKHFLGDRFVDYAKAPRNITNIEAMLWTYERTGDTRLLALAENSWRQFLKSASAAALPHLSDHCDLSEISVYADTPILAHGVDYIEVAKQPAILYLYTGKPEYLKFAGANQRRIFDHHMLVDGCPSTSEFYGYTTALNSHETCDISDHTWTWGYMLMASGDGVWADRIERACFNAGFGAIKKDWKGLQYFSAINQVSATDFRPNPGQVNTGCCAGNVHRLFPNYTIRMWMKAPHGGIAATLYGPSTLKTSVGATDDPIEVIQETDYPFGEEIHMTIHAAKPVSFPLSLRIPQWCDIPTLRLNGKILRLPRVKNGFATLDREFHPGDTLVLTLPMKAKATHWPENGVAVERGPLVFSLGVKEMWTSNVLPKYSNAEFPNWVVTTKSPWNYGLALGDGPLDEQLKFEKKPMTQDPWVNPPIALTVPLRRIPSWDLEPNPYHPGQYERGLTPALPDQSVPLATGPVEQIALVPYGSTHLRIAIFPDLAKRQLT